jgi:2-dehydropantoate 2-reductase
MRIAIFGSGGVGGYFGGRLAQAGHEVIFIARGQRLQAMREQGLQVESLNGDFMIRPVEATDQPATVGPVEAVLVAVKAWQVSEAAEAMRPMVGPETFVVPLQNGVEAPAQLAAVLGREHVLGGLCRIVSFMVRPEQVRHVGADPPYLAFGELDNRASERAQRLYQAFRQAQGVEVEIPADIQAAMWGKFMQICAWSGIGAITRSPVGVWRSLPETRQMWQDALAEVFAVAQARQIGLTEAMVAQVTAYVDVLPANATASMQRDIMNGRPSELQAQNGAVVRLGREVGAPTPTHAFIYQALLPLELKARGELTFPE